MFDFLHSVYLLIMNLQVSTEPHVCMVALLQAAMATAIHYSELAH